MRPHSLRLLEQQRMILERLDRIDAMLAPIIVALARSVQRDFSDVETPAGVTHAED